jgi:predicted nucleotidyltransferase
MSKIQKLKKEGLIDSTADFITDTHYEVIMGSFAYGVSNVESDVDLYGICVPPVNIVFPHTTGYVAGFGPTPPSFEQYQKHHINHDTKEYDVQIFSIIKFFDLAADNNPNIIDSLFVPDRCIVHIDKIGKIIRESRTKFLHKGAFHRYKGYSYAQMKKIRTMSPKESRKELVEKYGFDVKFAYHVVRLALQAEMILVEHDLDLEKNREQLKAIRRGEWTLDYLEEWFKNKEKQLDELYLNSSLRHKPDYDELKRILLICLEEKYGDMSTFYKNVDTSVQEKYNKIVKVINGEI